MTRDEILSLTPERLRAEIAKRKGYVIGSGPMDSAAKYSGCKWWTAPDGRRTSVIPDWTSDITAAWELVEEMNNSEEGLSDLWYGTVCGKLGWIYTFRFYFMGAYKHGATELIASSDTAPLAICRAWLMWKEENDKHNA